jgi:hypothetical protein
MTTPIQRLDHAVRCLPTHTARVQQRTRDGVLVGMLTQADLAEHLPLAEIGSLVRKVSASTRRPLLTV